MGVSCSTGTESLVVPIPSFKCTSKMFQFNFVSTGSIQLYIDVHNLPNWCILSLVCIRMFAPSFRPILYRKFPDLFRYDPFVPVLLHVFLIWVVEQKIYIRIWNKVATIGRPTTGHVQDTFLTTLFSKHIVTSLCQQHRLQQRNVQDLFSTAST